MSYPVKSAEAKIIADSISNNGHRITTVEAKIHRFVLAELNTHRVFSRNSASSRAIPTARFRQMCMDDPAMPIYWGSAKPGMQSGEELTGRELAQVERHWLDLRDEAIQTHIELEKIGLHKSVANRILEPFMWHRVIITATEWDNFFHQRVHKDAQPEMGLGNPSKGLLGAARAIWKAYLASSPEKLSEGAWHLPYIRAEERGEFSAETLKMISTGRCARVSYLNHDGIRDVGEDINLYHKLVSQFPGHWAPLEHVATPCPSMDSKVYCGNFVGWRQLRKLVEPTLEKFLG